MSDADVAESGVRMVIVGRVFPSFMAVVLVLGMMPFPAFAVDEPGEYLVGSAIPDEIIDEDDQADDESVNSISFRPVRAFELVEGVDGHEVIGDDGSVRYVYDVPEFRSGDALTVTYSDGEIVEYVYGCYEFDDEEDEEDEEDEVDEGENGDEGDDGDELECEEDEGDEGDDGYCFASDDEDVLDEDELSCAWKDPVEKWIAGTTYQMVITYCGCSCSVDVELIANPVKSIEFTPKVPYRFLEEGEDYGYWVTAEYGESGDPWFCYFPPNLDEGDQLTVNAWDGTKTVYVVKWRDDEDDYFLVGDGAVVDASGVEFATDQDCAWETGVHQMTVTFMGHSCSVDVEVMKSVSLKNASISFAKGVASFPYEAAAIEPDVIVKIGDDVLVEDVDYEVSYKNNVNVGDKATVKVLGIGVCKDSKSATFKIAPLSLKKAKLTLSKDSFVWNKKVQKPSIKAVGGKKLKSADYEVRYSNPKSSKVGSYAVWVIGKGNCSGASKKATYKILKANPVKIAAKKPVVSFAKLEATDRVVASKKAFAVTGNKGGKVSFKKESGDGGLSVDSNGNVTVAAGSAKGSHVAKVVVSVASKGNVAPVTKSVTLKVTVK